MHSRTRTLIVILGRTLLAQTASVSACPLCSTERGAEVRAALFSTDSLSLLVATAAPFAVIISILWMLHVALQSPPASARTPDRAS